MKRDLKLLPHLLATVGLACSSLCWGAGEANPENPVSSAADEALHTTALPAGELSNGGYIHHTITINPLGLFDGEGVNLQYEQPFLPKWSWLASGRYARAASGSGTLTSIGATLGFDYYIAGRNNEGLFVGPRGRADIGAATVGSNSVLGSFGVQGEGGYNWVASNGITAGIAGGLDLNLGGALNTTQISASGGGLSLTPYGKINLGYSW